mmetsp:Transcript_177976/g.432992  ORF Transcript_177976/g.432992 Transcript_177976/m.432992 type:complete len:223 (+) Transcript_177976:554-1222(+)
MLGLEYRFRCHLLELAERGTDPCPGASCGALGFSCSSRKHSAGRAALLPSSAPFLGACWYGWRAGRGGRHRQPSRWAQRYPEGLAGLGILLHHRCFGILRGVREDALVRHLGASSSHELHRVRAREHRLLGSLLPGARAHPSPGDQGQDLPCLRRRAVRRGGGLWGHALVAVPRAVPAADLHRPAALLRRRLRHPPRQPGGPLGSRVRRAPEPRCRCHADDG